MNTDRIRKQRAAAELDQAVEEAGRLAKKLGLAPFDVNYWVVDHREMNQLIAYDGFQRRYPHWRWGMKYDRQRKQDQYSGGKAFEIVNNDDPANAFLQESNDLADQKAVITHVEAHSDFFANNEWFGLFTGSDGREGAGRGPDAAAMLERHAETLERIIADPEIDRDEVERFMDSVLCLEDTIDQHLEFTRTLEFEEDDEEAEVDVSELDLSDEVVDEVFDDEWLEAQREARAGTDQPESDVLGYVREYGMQYDDEADRATEFEDWQREVLDVLRTEAYYFAPQKMTKVMNEGWASYFESLMMSHEAFADDDEFLSYADHMAQVLGSPGLNPYKLGLQLWKYVENRRNRREVIERLLKVDGVIWRTFQDAVDFEHVQELLEPDPLVASVPADDPEALYELPDELVDETAVQAAVDGEADLVRYPWKALTYEGLARRHYSLTRPQHRGFLSRVSQTELERTARYLFDDDRYPTVEQALADVEYTAGWDRMYEVRESHNDVTFIDEFLTQEFVDAFDYFTYEYAHATEDFRATSTDADDVKKKLLLQFTNFGKPTIVVLDGNYRNRNELLLGHRYNGVALDLPQARRALERTFDLWGRPVNLKTIVKRVDDHDLKVAKRRNREPEPEEVGLLVRYDGEEFEETELDDAEVEDIAADDVDYDTKPEDWLA
jgi:stage V sporulation protein R